MKLSSFTLPRVQPGVFFPAARPFAWRRWSLWPLLIGLVTVMLVTLVWLAGRYEASQVQSRIERDVGDAIADIRSGLARDLQSLQALQSASWTPGIASPPQAWNDAARQLLRERRELVRIESRDRSLRLLASIDSPYRAPPMPGDHERLSNAEESLTCATARRTGTPMYSPSYFMRRQDGLGFEVVELCVPVQRGLQPTGYLVATFALQEVLSELIGPQITRHQDVSFTEPDGTRLAARHGSSKRGTRLFSAHQLLDLPGTALVLRMDSWHGAPSVFPNVLTALVTFMSIALVSVLVLLSKDNRRRLQAEHDLAEALAFRKAMEDSLVTGLRARDLQGRITYVNPAFCKMVGFDADELLGHDGDLPYWPPERADENRRRQAHRLAGDAPPPPQEGVESTFMRRDGTRFPVLIIEAPLINAQGLHTGWMGAFLDLSEQRRSEELSRASAERLQATARLATVGEMASLLSHELNQPLAAISSYATGSLNLLAHDGSRGPAPDAGTLRDISMAMHRIGEQAERAGRVIRSVNDFVRRRDQSREAIAARALIDAVMPLIGLQARKLSVEVRIRVDAGLPPTQCDRTMVEQVLLNLARNGMQAMAQVAIPQRILEIGARLASADARGQWIEFRVCDRGPGIAPEVAAQLFTPFFTTKTEGMGLGLSLCRTVIEQHGGQLGHGPQPGAGTIFFFTLPTGKKG
ncbi:two-component system sensor histidine kinase NtrB [Xylophilus sp. GOD-11R]|uniref:two-component system sensor histidine kinase NtrB n=1 Tax=Xylophilus sp. GOD-11R TaxID=3089814 RepID=UPI00298D43DC|nr:ATP-binding protein [Xylophilus sp. GOD-11R]WPB57126.1 PAS domain S-box protein [Xylophilus sp. GOD-11R]